MTALKHILLAGTAGIITIVAARAADLPVKAKAAEYVRVCSLYGAGFYYIPGTDTCLRLGGYVRAEADYNAAGSFNPVVGPGGGGGNRQFVDSRESSAFVQRTRVVWSFDTRTATEYGTLRSYARAGMQWSTGDSVNAGSNATPYLFRAYLQFAGLTAGRTDSFFDIYGFEGLQSFQTGIIGGSTSGQGLNLFAYTADLGGGLSATIATEENTSRSKPVINTIGTAGFFSLTTANSYATGTLTSQAGQTVPDLVGTLRYDQPWGVVGAAVGVHRVGATYYALDTTTAGGGAALAVGGGAGGLQTLGHPDDKWGWAGTVGASTNLPWAKGDTFGIQLAYAQGATAYVGRGQGSFARYDGRAIGLGFITDAVFAGQGTQLELTTGWSIVAGVEHHWNPKWRTSFYGGYEHFSYNANATQELCAGLSGKGAGTQGSGFTITNCNPDFGFWQVGSRTVWNPVRELDVGVEVIYSQINSAFSGPVTLTANGTVPAGPFTARDVNFVSGVFRVQRNFLP
jgi:hypothetical protein